MAIRQIKSGKAAGPDNIPAEALKADVAANARILHILFNKIWDEEQVPTYWKEGLLIKYRRKAISATVITTGASLSSQYQVKSPTGYY
ncbi:unnamed protein product [Schistosoma margrebowiei]|uniref:Uncharacterized protein n=1 Tax=Schistosoma margrebowiei TaxID=48269 RepID=A0A183LY82_9TREM|nr:unnamed protein product [Schistosoma margrebowiei]